ncbi:hypothetical protein G3A39_41215 [Paraburkholderia aspalathi]|nr:hypothetical protein [Paraburkholderia aspalathi]
MTETVNLYDLLTEAAAGEPIEAVVISKNNPVLRGMVGQTNAIEPDLSSCDIPLSLEEARPLLDYECDKLGGLELNNFVAWTATSIIIVKDRVPIRAEKFPRNPVAFSAFEW